MKNSNWKIIFICTIIIGGFFSLFASSFPDGLEKVAEKNGFLGNGKQLVDSIMLDYKISGIRTESLSKSLAGIIGTCMVFICLFFAGRLLYKLDGKNK